MSNNNRSSTQRFLPQAIQTFLWGQAREHLNDVTDSQQGRFRSRVPGLSLINTSIYLEIIQD